jgi:riboflavin biosynthesis pyrimidine reductase
VNEAFDLQAGPVTASLVVSATGSAVSEQGTSKGLGNSTDLSLLKWFRNRSEIVLTSGKTAELENYRLPSTAQLAILSRADRTYQSLGQDKTKVIFLDKLASFGSAIEELRKRGYERIHCEFGPTGFVELLNQNLAAGFVSSVNVTGIELFAMQHELLVGTLEEFGGDLLVARLLGRG